MREKKFSVKCLLPGDQSSIGEALLDGRKEVLGQMPAAGAMFVAPDGHYSVFASGMTG